jgi:hypothetical protein
MNNWTTLLNPELVEQYGHQGEIHNVWFLPTSERQGRCAVLLIPECEFQFVQTANGETVEDEHAT